MLASTDIRQAAFDTSRDQLQETIKLFVTRLIDKFIETFRKYQVERLQTAYTSELYIKATQEKMINKKVSDNPEQWDLGTLASIFHTHADDVFKNDYGGDLRRVIPIMMQIKDMRNRRVHEVSKNLPIYAREAYVLADNACRFFELMTIAVPKELLDEFHTFRKEALQLLYVEELHNEASKDSRPEQNVQEQ